MTKRCPWDGRLWGFPAGWLLLFFLLLSRGVSAQSDHWPDSLKRGLAKVTDPGQKAWLAGNLAYYYFGQNRALSDDYGRQAVQTAEISRDRMLMIRTYIMNGRRFLEGAELKADLEQGVENFRRAEQIAKDDNLDEGLVYSYCELAHAYRALGENDQALACSNQAVTAAGDVDKDSAQVMAYTSLGQSYEARNEKLLAFRNYLKALDIAEEKKNVEQIRNAIAFLSFFYENISEYDKAIDYKVTEIGLDRSLKNYFSLRGDYDELGRLFTHKKEYDIAIGFFEHAIALADTLHFDLLKINSYFDIFEMYFKDHQYKKGMAYLSGHPQVTDFLNRAGMDFIIDEMYAQSYEEMARYDSATFYFNREGPAIESRANAFSKAEFYDAMGEFSRRQGMTAKAIAYYLKEQDIGKSVGDLQILQSCALNLDSLYREAGDYRMAYTYHTGYAQYTDSLRNLTKESDLLKLEVDNDNRRRERQEKEDELSKEHRHNVQYMGFTMGIVVFFIALVMMGWLAVPASLIRASGFLSFIFLFEFIILLADKQIQGWTHEEPWKILVIKVGLAAILVPLHHWLEHKVIHYLSSRKRFSGGKGGKAGAAELNSEL